jgi:DNA-binding SARP family transcriptional activator
LERALEGARISSAADNLSAARRALSDALALAAGPLLPEDGPDDWIRAKRDHYRLQVCGAALTLAEMLIEAREPDAAAAACRRGLQFDRCSDRLWRLLVAAHDAAGDVLAAERGRREYLEVMAELGISPDACH